MEKAGSTGKTVHMQWVAQKKSNYEWLTVLVASVLGFGLVIALITFAELANMGHR